MRDKHTGKSPVSPLMCDFSDTKSSLKMRLASIFEDSKKKKGVISLIIALIIIGLIGSFFVFGKKEVKQVNDSLTIYTMGYETVDGEARYRDSYDYRTVVKDYKRNYKDVDVNVIEFPDVNLKTFADKVVTEILAGKGPDVIIFDETMMSFKDINKIIASGVIEPMDDFLATDETFKQENFYPGILKSGVYRGKRYAFPIRFNIPLILSGENVLKNAGIDQEECKKDYASFMGQCAEYVNENIDNDSAGQLFMFDNTTFTGELLNYVGGNPTKENKNIDTPEFRKLVENMKSVNQLKLKNDSKPIFIGTLDNALTTIGNSTISLLKEEDQPALVPICKPNGNMEALITAAAMINSNSENKQNAYNFIKQLMTHNSNNYFKNCGISSRKAYGELQLELRYDQMPNIFADVTKRVVAFYSAKEKFDEIKVMVNLIDSANFVTPIVEIIKTELQPFFEDKMTYEECIKQAQTKVDLYFAE